MHVPPPNRIERVVHGCALVEHWRETTGVEGQSLFYYQRARRDWKQVWVSPGVVKEKHLVARYPGGAVRFQGEIPLPNGPVILDRTTLTPLPGGRVRQVIEQSTDGGTTWAVGFDAVYVKGKEEIRNTSRASGRDVSRGTARISYFVFRISYFVSLTFH